MQFPEDSFPKSLPIDRNRELLKTAREEIYKSVNGVDLPVYIWGPDPEKAPPYPKSVAAFFFSSGWDNGQVSQFAPHCVYFASRGMTTLAFDYRVAARQSGGPLQAMADARSALRWIRLNAVEMGINPGKIVGIGGSGGAHAITSAAMLGKEYDERDEDAEQESENQLPDGVDDQIGEPGSLPGDGRRVDGDALCGQRWSTGRRSIRIGDLVHDAAP
jgi:hypothetical protein